MPSPDWPTHGLQGMPFGEQVQPVTAFHFREELRDEKGEYMTKSELIAQVAGEAQVKKVDAEKAVNALLKVMSETLKTQGRLALAGFGTFVVAERKAREGRNPQTGEPLKIPASKVVKFKPGKQLKDLVK